MRWGLAGPADVLEQIDVSLQQIQDGPIHDSDSKGLPIYNGTIKSNEVFELFHLIGQQPQAKIDNALSIQDFRHDGVIAPRKVILATGPAFLLLRRRKSKPAINVVRAGAIIPH
jgi:hypothetical protein